MGGMYVPSSMGLKNEHGTKYVYLPATCKTPKPWMSLPNTGATIAHCYRVEKNIDKFDVIYEKLDEHRKLKQTVIGNKEYGQKGLVEQVNEHRKYIENDKNLKAKFVGASLVVGTLWTLLLKFWDKIFA